jgi:hypothetical protein
MDPANILHTVPGDHVGRGSNSLPDPASSDVEKAEVTLEADHVGRVTITYERRKMRHGKSVHWAWIAVEATAVPPNP